MANEQKTRYALTTVDNPYDPFTQFDSWFLYDVEKGYNTCGLLARIVNENEEIIDEVDEDEENTQIEKAIDIIIKNDFTNMYRKIKR